MATETAVEKLQKVTSAINQAVQEAIGAIENALGFRLPKGFEEGFQNVADAMVRATQIIYDAWQRGEGKAKQAGKFSEHVKKIFETMQIAADFMRQAERPAKLMTEAVTRIAGFVDLSVIEMDKMAAKYEVISLISHEPHLEEIFLAFYATEEDHAEQRVSQDLA